jgi:hypothetical protein
LFAAARPQKGNADEEYYIPLMEIANGQMEHESVLMPKTVESGPSDFQNHGHVLYLYGICFYDDSARMESSPRFLS